MNPNCFFKFIVIYGACFVNAELKFNSSIRGYNALIDHTKQTDSVVFPYAVAILRKFSYFGAGALLDDRWVLTAADSFFLLRESSRVIRVRLGSINYKKGGAVMPIKKIEIHPFFDDSKPVYDVALLRLAFRVRLTPSLYPIRLQTKLKDVTSTHFIVTAWQPTLHVTKNEENQKINFSMDEIKKRRMLSVSHLHPTNAGECQKKLGSLDVQDTEAIMCLDTDLKTDPCWRDTGAPVVLNGILWGVISSWHVEDCALEPGPTFVNLVAAKNISSWIHSTTHSTKWNQTAYIKFERSREDYSNEFM